MKRSADSQIEQQTISSIISHCLLFSAMEPDQISKISREAQVIELKAGEQLFEQGQSAKAFYQVASGAIKLSLYSAGGNEKIIDVITPGNTFGEALMFNRVPTYPLNAAALSKSKLVSFSNESYVDILHGSTDACFATMAKMSMRLHRLIGEIDRLTLQTAPARVAYYLIALLPDDQTDAASVKLDVPKHVLAARLSITPETLSRCFSRLIQDGLIKMADSTITLVDSNRLRKLMSLGSL